jgi:hypothetical protein
MSHEEKIKYWSDIIDRRKHSKQKTKTWLKENNICKSSFYKWSRIINEINNTSSKAVSKENGSIFESIVLEDNLDVIEITINGYKLSVNDKVIHKIIGAMK